MKMPNAFIPGTENINAIIETPRGTGSKYIFDKELNLFRLKKILPKGTVFPYHFGFIPNTVAEDGDPLDIMVMMEEPAYPGCLIECRILGVIEGESTTGKGIFRNDRFIGAALESETLKKLSDLTDIAQYEQDEIVNFLIAYTNLSGQKFRPLHLRGRNAALALIKKQVAS